MHLSDYGLVLSTETSEQYFPDATKIFFGKRNCLKFELYNHGKYLNKIEVFSNGIVKGNALYVFKYECAFAYLEGTRYERLHNTLFDITHKFPNLVQENFVIAKDIVEAILILAQELDKFRFSFYKERFKEASLLIESLEENVDAIK